MEFNLKAHRCPTAQVLMNRALEKFMASDANELVITTIEPTLKRNTEARIAGLNLKAEVSDVYSREISDKDLQAWQDAFDEDDFGGVNKIVTITVTKPKRELLKQVCYV
tara:strand:- start:570 stop:896 length:327 start_codon:yes stop_codon:yes gene_type:complete